MESFWNKSNLTFFEHWMEILSFLLTFYPFSLKIGTKVYDTKRIQPIHFSGNYF